MAKRTIRDKVWRGALICREQSDESGPLPDSFSIGDVREAGGVPGSATDRTVADTLATMSEWGFIDYRGGKGGDPARYYSPGALDREG